MVWLRLASSSTTPWSSPVYESAREPARWCERGTAAASRSVAVSITHEHGITRNSSGRITYLYIDERTAIVEPYEQIYRSADGSSLAVKSRVTFLEFVEITTSDRLTLPGGGVGPILRISHAIADDDGNGLATVVLLGG